MTPREESKQAQFAKYILEKVNDEFAIGFGEWCDNKGYTQVGNNFWKSLNDENGKTSKELLEIYKKEKES